MTHGEIKKDWEWLFSNVTETLHSFDNEEDITEFVCCKIQSVLATTQENLETEGKMKRMININAPNWKIQNKQ